MRSGPVVVVCSLLLLAGCGGGSSNSSSTPSIHPPTANAGGPYTGAAGTAVSFSGAASSDPQGETLTYAWNFGDSGTGTGVSPSHTYAAPGTYTVSLTVTNTGNLTATATSKATIALVPLTDVGITGVVSSGSTPIVGAHVYLFAANITGYGGAGIAASSGNASLSLLSAAETGTSDSLGAYVATGSNGGFSLTGDYTCSSGQQLYLYALGGNNGSGTNSAAGLMAVIGSCPASGSSAITATVNEVTTIAAAYAFAGFATDATHVSSSGTALAQVGIANAFANAANLVNLLNGTALATTPAGNGTVPQTEINTLANILADCVDTSGPGSNGCALLLSNAMSGGSTGTAPTDTATAAINIAHHPGTGVAALYGLASSGPFTPMLSAQPNDFTVALYFTGGGLDNPQRIAIDGSGNAWVANEFSPGSVTKLSSSGSILSGAGGYTGGGMDEPSGIAIDGSGNAWVANYAGSVTKLSSSGSILSGTSGFPAGGLIGYSTGITIDGSGNVWIPAYGFPVTKLSSSGSVLSGANGFTGSGLTGYSSGIAIDGSGNAWVAVSGNIVVTELSSSGSILSGTNGFFGGGMWNPSAIAMDGSGNAWVANLYGHSITKLSNSGAFLSGANGFTGGDLDFSVGIAIDGSGNAWVVNGYSNSGVNSGLGSITELSSSGSILSGLNGLTGGNLDYPLSIAIDGSGNVWVGSSFSAVSELIGAAVPVITPVVAGLPVTPTTNGSSNLGTRP